MAKPWNDKCDQVLREFIEIYADRRQGCRRFSELYGFEVKEVRQQMLNLGVEPFDIEDEAGTEISDATRFALGLGQKLTRKEKVMMAHFTAVVHEAMQMQAAPVDTPKPSPKLESLVLQISDWHFGKMVVFEDQVVYDLNIAKERVKILSEHILEMLRHHMKKSFAELVILITGDIVDGADIYASQAYSQDITVPRQVEEAVLAIWGLILALRPYFPSIRVRGVRGNHGRQSKTAPPDSNFDIMVYMQLAMIQVGAQLPNLDIRYSMSETMDVTVHGKKIHIRHEAPQQSETPAGRAKYVSWFHRHGCDIACSGHFHTHTWGECLCKPVIKCGSIVGPDDLAEKIAKYSDPAQLMFTVPPKSYPIIGSVYKIHLVRTPKEEEIIGNQNQRAIWAEIKDDQVKR